MQSVSQQLGLDFNKQIILPTSGLQLRETTIGQLIKDQLSFISKQCDCKLEVQQSQIIISQYQQKNLQQIQQNIKTLEQSIIHIVNTCEQFSTQISEKQKLLEFCEWHSQLSQEELPEAKQQLIEQLRDLL